MALILLTSYWLGIPISAQSVDSSEVISLAESYFRVSALVDAPKQFYKVRTQQEMLNTKSLLPFVEKSIDEEIWTVVFDSVVLADRGPCETPSTHVFYIRKSDGTFIAEIMYWDNEPDSALEVAEKMSTCIPTAIRTVNYEFVGFVKEPPAIPLSSAFERAVMSNPCQSQVVVTFLARVKNRKKIELTAWFVVGVGGPASGLDNKNPTGSETWLTIVNAETGAKVLFAQLDSNGCQD